MRVRCWARFARSISRSILGDGPARCHRKQYIAAFVGVERTVRASLALYNSGEDIDAVVSALLRIQAGFRS